MLIGDNPNTYTFSKAMAEGLFYQDESDLPVGIVRPGAVAGSLKEPFPGWIDNYGAYTGALAPLSQGILRSVIADPKTNVEMVPVDICINLMCAAAWKVATEKSGSNIPVYNCAGGARNKINHQQLFSKFLKIVRKSPSKNQIFYPRFSPTQNYYLNNFYQVIWNIRNF